MQISTKIIIAVSSIVAACLISFIIYKQIEISNRQLAIEQQFVQQKELTDNITRSSNQYATKDDISKFIKDNNMNLKAIQDDLKTLRADIVSINTVKVTTPGYKATNIPSTPGTSNPNPTIPTVECNGEKIPCPNADPNGYLQKQQTLTLEEPFDNVKVPLGDVGFSAWEKDPWSINILPRTYRLSSVVGVDENQRQYFYNKFFINTNGKEYEVKINSAETKQQYPEDKFFWWAPNLSMGLDSGYNLTDSNAEFTPSINFSFLAYGKYRTQPTFSFAQVGLGYETINKSIRLILTPAAYNIGKHVPFINNTYIGPSIQFGLDGDVSIMGGARILF